MYTIIEEKMLSIVKDNSAEIYNNKDDFANIVSQVFAGDDIAKLLKKIILEDGATEVYKLKDLPSDDFVNNFNDILDVIADNTFIAKDILTPAVQLLILGLGINNSCILNDFNIENGVLLKYIGKSENVVLPNTITCIGQDAFSFCNEIVSVTIPSSVTCIEQLSFWTCKNLTSVTFSPNINSIGLGAFSSCRNLKEVVLPNGMRSIEPSVFKDCKSLVSVTLPNSIIAIAEEAFSKCSSLTNINILTDINFIGDNAFEGCESLPMGTIQEIRKVNPFAVY